MKIWDCHKVIGEDLRWSQSYRWRSEIDTKLSMKISDCHKVIDEDLRLSQIYQWRFDDVTRLLKNIQFSCYVKLYRPPVLQSYIMHCVGKLSYEHFHWLKYSDLWIRIANIYRETGGCVCVCLCVCVCAYVCVCVCVCVRMCVELEGLFSKGIYQSTRRNILENLEFTRNTSGFSTFLTLQCCIRSAHSCSSAVLCNSNLKAKYLATV
jgi:hypothetical protein